MKAQTQRTAPHGVGTRFEVTPVIIKIGGGGGGGGGDVATHSDTQEIQIETVGMTFSDDTGQYWLQAQSQYSGRIHELTIADGMLLPPLYYRVLPQPQVLSSLQLRYTQGDQTELLTIGEVLVKSSIFLKITSSSVLFKANKPPHNNTDEWTESKAVFTGKPVKAVFTQMANDGTQELARLEYEFSSIHIGLNVDFHTDIFKG